MIVAKHIEEEIYFMVDGILFAYFCIIFMIVSKSGFYNWVWDEIKKMRKMRRFKLYVMESLRNWKYDITELNQSFFIINLIILFLGYNHFKKYNLLNACNYEIEYFIVCGYSLVIHLLQSYNNYYTQS